MNVASATISFNSKPQVRIGGEAKAFTQLEVNGKTFQGVDMGNGTFARLNDRGDGKFDVKLFRADGKDLSKLSVKVNGGSLSRMKMTSGQKFGGQRMMPLKNETLRFTPDFAKGYQMGAARLMSKPKTDQPSVILSLPKKVEIPKLDLSRLNLTKETQDDLVELPVLELSSDALVPEEPVLLELPQRSLDEIEHLPEHALKLDVKGNVLPETTVKLGGDIPTTFKGRLDKLCETRGPIKGMATGLSAIKDSGLVPSHVEKFKSVAKNTNTILMFRPVNPMSTGLLEEGTAAKGLNVHGKSSDWGPMAGYIAFDQALSKKHGDMNSIKKGNEDNAHSIEGHDSAIQSKQLSLSPSRIKYLTDEKLIQPSNEHGEPLTGDVPEGGTQYFVNGGGKEGKSGNGNYMFKLEPKEGGFTVSYKSLKDPVTGPRVNDWSELKVMGDAKSDKPLTADYDMFAMMPKVVDGQLAGESVNSRIITSLTKQQQTITKELNNLKEQIKNQEKFPTGSQELKDASRTIRNLRGKAVVLQAKIIQQSRGEGRLDEGTIAREFLGTSERNQVDPELGRLTTWQRDIRNELNGSVKGEGGYNAGDLVKHGTEQDNTQFSEKDDRIFIITPDGETFMTQDWEQTQAFMWTARQDDYLSYNNRSYRSENDHLTTPNPTQTTFYPGQDRGDKFSGTRLDFDSRTAAVNYGLIDTVSEQDVLNTINRQSRI